MLPFSLFVLKSRVTFYKIGYFNIIAHLLMCVMYLCVVFALVCMCLQNVGCPVLYHSLFYSLKDGWFHWTRSQLYLAKLAGQWTPVIVGISPSLPSPLLAVVTGVHAVWLLGMGTQVLMIVLPVLICSIFPVFFFSKWIKYTLIFPNFKNECQNIQYSISFLFQFLIQPLRTNLYKRHLCVVLSNFFNVRVFWNSRVWEPSHYFSKQPSPSTHPSWF